MQFEDYNYAAYNPYILVDKSVKQKKLSHQAIEV